MPNSPRSSCLVESSRDQSLFSKAATRRTDLSAALEDCRTRPFREEALLQSSYTAATTCPELCCHSLYSAQLSSLAASRADTDCSWDSAPSARRPCLLTSTTPDSLDSPGKPRRAGEAANGTLGTVQMPCPQKAGKGEAQALSCSQGWVLGMGSNRFSAAPHIFPLLLLLFLLVLLALFCSTLLT